MMPHLLSDRDVRQFITEGYLVVRVGKSRAFHRGVYDEIESLLAKEGNPGNNILPRIPSIQQVYDDPAIAGALTSLLGPNYLMHPHRYCHLNSPGSKTQTWHKDDYVFDQNVRRHRFRWVMAFYYPQDVSEEMGPTGIIPRSQYRNSIASDTASEPDENVLPLCGEAGTVTIVNFDIWHRACANLSDKPRFMLKFQFTRMHEPDSPSWDNRSFDWHSSPDDPTPRLGESVWRWLTGQTGNRDHVAREEQSRLSDLDHACEAVRLNAIYTLPTESDALVESLIDTIRHHGEAAGLAATATTSCNPQGGNPSDTAHVHALGALGEAAVPVLIRALDDDAWWVRCASAEALGNIGAQARAAVDCLLKCLRDGEVWVRRNAAEALGTVGGLTADMAGMVGSALSDVDERVRRNIAFSLSKQPLQSVELLPQLSDALEDDSRYVRYYAATALRRAGTSEANEVLWNSMLAQRWCSLTTTSSPY